MGWRPRVNSREAEVFGYEKCNQLTPIIAAQKSLWSKSGRATYCSRSNLVELRFGLVFE